MMATKPVLALSASDQAQLESWARGAYPDEACALLVGTGEPPVITRLVACANVAPERRRRFEVDPAARIRLEVALRGTPERVVGVWHSHPDGTPEPSATDAAMVYEPDLIWLITAVAPAECATRAFQPAEGGFQELQLNG
jgi:proteasome lid subunit RPN8/RPN11